MNETINNVTQSKCHKIPDSLVERISSIEGVSQNRMKKLFGEPLESSFESYNLDYWFELDGIYVNLYQSHRHEPTEWSFAAMTHTQYEQLISLIEKKINSDEHQEHVVKTLSNRELDGLVNLLTGKTDPIKADLEHKLGLDLSDAKNNGQLRILALEEVSERWRNSL